MAMEQRVETNERPVYDSNLQFIIASNEPPLRRLQRAPLLLNGKRENTKSQQHFAGSQLTMTTTFRRIWLHWTTLRSRFNVAKR